MMRSLAVLCVSCALMGCQEPVKPPPAPAPPDTRSFDVWADGLAFYHPDESGALVQIADVDKVPYLWRELIIVDFDDDVDVKESYYLVTLSRDGAPQAQAQLIAGRELARRVDALLQAQSDAPQAPEPPAPLVVQDDPPRRRPPSAPREPAAPSEPAGIVVEGITRAPAVRQSAPLKRLGGTTQAALPAAEHRRELAATLNTLNDAREQGMRCPGIPDGRRSALREHDMLARVAQSVALDMAQTGNALREEADVRPHVRAAGYKGQTRSITTEGVHSGRAFVTKYLESQCVTLMNPRLRSFGFGAARTNTGYYWVMIVGDT